MPKLLKPLFPDPRPSRADPEHRQRRKQLEKDHGYDWVPPVVLGLIGLTLAYDVAKDVEKCEEKHRKEGEEAAERAAPRRRRRRRNRESVYAPPPHASRRRRSYDDLGGKDQEASGDDGGGEAREGYYEGRRRRLHRRDEDRKQRVMPDGSDVHNGYEASGGAREAGVERAESLERGKVDDAKYDGGLDQADQLEKGEGGFDEDRVYSVRPRRSIAYHRDDVPRSFRRRLADDDDDDDDDFLGYEYVEERRGRRDLDPRRSRPRARRLSSDW